MFSKSAFWLVACVLIACYSRQGTRTLEATSIFDPGTAGIISYASSSPQENDNSNGNTNKQEPQLELLRDLLLERQQQQQQQQKVERKRDLQLVGELDLGDEEQQQQQQRQQARSFRVTPRIKIESLRDLNTFSGGPFLRPRPISANLNRGDQILRKRLIDVLDTLSDHIPARAGQAAAAAPRLSRSGESSGLTLEDEAPIYRSGRTFPSASSLPSFRSSAPRDAVPVYLEGPKFLLRGVGDVSGSGSAINGGGSGQRNLRNPIVKGGVALTTPLFYSQPNAAPASTKSAHARPYANQHQQQQRISLADTNEGGATSAALLDGASSSQQQQQQHFRRSGSEEVALHTPTHSAGANDYEWKRVENQRSWNNLRGMWGKRSVSPTESGDEVQARFSELLKSSSQVQEEDARSKHAVPAAAEALPAKVDGTERSSD